MKRSKALQVFSMTAGIFFFIVFIWQVANSKFRYSDNLVVLEKEFNSISAPTSVTSIDHRRLSKWVMQSISEDYTFSQPKDVILNYYEEVLLSRGWKKKNKSFNKSGSETRIFCKDNMDAIIEIQNSKYYFGVKWDGSPNVPTGCN